jgi:hypothetical protein
MVRSASKNRWLMLQRAGAEARQWLKGEKGSQSESLI